MNWAYIHLYVNHFPVTGVIIGTLLLIAGMGFKNRGVIMSGLGTVVFASLTAVVAYLTGNPAEEAVKVLPDAARSLVSRHEDMAAVAMYLVIPAGLLASLSLYSILMKEKSERFLVIITLVLALLSSAVMVYTGHTGGQIRHSEFRDTASRNHITEHQNDTIDD